MEDTGEPELRGAHERGDMETLVRLGLERYQVEIYSFLCARLGAESDAHEVFAQLSEDVWRGVAGFAWRCSFRTWLYTLARHAAMRFERTPANQARRQASLSAAPEPVAVDRSRTRPYLRTDVKDRFAALRSSLTADEQSLLVLRIDRELPWDDVARIMHDDEPDDAELRRRVTNLRQRFRQLKERLREKAKADGLIDD